VTTGEPRSHVWRAAALEFGRRHGFDEAHALQVAALSLRLFDGLRRLHGLGPAQRRLLHAAALLHDVGGAVSLHGHHKHSLELIRRSRLPGLTPRQLAVVANVARYHRKAMPQEGHAPFAALGPVERERVRTLAALLRVADALDRDHAGRVRFLRACLRRDGVRVELIGPADVAPQRAAVERKLDLFRQVFARPLRVCGEGDRA
jgi:exopolyphosphatase / guanosine-5'-triphosphate,3'-diphosphate pyrophosphatase